MKLPWMKFCTADWIADLGHHELEIEGMWIRICCHIQRRGASGSLEMTINEWSNLLRKSEEECEELLQCVTRYNLGNVTDCNGIIKVTCRRLEREAGQQSKTYERVKKFRMKRKCNTNLNENVTGKKLEVRSKKLEIDKEKDLTTFAPSDKKTIVSVPKISFTFENHKWQNITDQDFTDWQAVYPACNIESELGKMAMWLLANPTKRKSNYRKFITNWLNRSQDKGGSK